MAAAKGNKYSQKWTPELIEELCKEIIEFALEDRTVHFVEFAYRKKKTHGWLNRMEEDYPEFKEAYATAKEMLAAKLVAASIYGHPTNDKFNGTHAMSWKNVYSKVQQDYDKKKEDMKKKELSEEEANIIVKAVNYAKKES